MSLVRLSLALFHVVTQVRIFARKSAIEAKQGDYALNITGDILKFFEGYYGVEYPLPKSGERKRLRGGGVPC